MDCFHKKNSNLKIIFFFGGGGGRGVLGGGRAKWMDRGTVPNQFAPSLSSNNTAFIYKLCPRQSQFMTILSSDLQV